MCELVNVLPGRIVDIPPFSLTELLCKTTRYILKWTHPTRRTMAAAAQAAAQEAAASGFGFHIVEGGCRRLEASDCSRRAAALRRL